MQRMCHLAGRTVFARQVVYVQKVARGIDEAVGPGAGPGVWRGDQRAGAEGLIVPARLAAHAAAVLRRLAPNHPTGHTVQRFGEPDNAAANRRSSAASAAWPTAWQQAIRPSRAS
jgi:hypothetical protein